jgi:tetraacyldisaccharide 4'-kinase
VIGRVAARVYGWEIGRRNRRFDAGRGVVRFDRPVISVGNLSVGGTGKTPMVAHVVETLLAARRRPCIAMRGYAARGGVSDEAEEYRRRFPGVPVVARPDRATALIELFARAHDGESEATDCVVLDDGFQHRRIARDLDIVLIDATRSPFEDELLPAGWLREPVASLRRAGLVVVSHAELAEAQSLSELSAAIERVRGRGAEVVARHSWAGLAVTDKGVERDEAIGWLRGKRVVAVCAIGNPAAFVAEAKRAVGGELAGEIVLRDHHPYGRAEVERIWMQARMTQAEVVLTTEKDWSKLGAAPTAPSGGRWHRSWPCAVARAKLGLSFDRGGEELTAAIVGVTSQKTGDVHTSPERSDG